MRFSDRTKTILKNFVTINPSIYFKSGNELATIAPSTAVLAKATIEDTIDGEFSIYDLSKFLSTLDLFTTPEMTIENDVGIISEGNRKVKYGFTDKSLIVTLPDKQINLSNPEFTFNLEAKTFGSAMKALSILGLTDIAFVSDGNSVSLTVLDSKGAISDSYSEIIGESEQEFKVVFKAENLKLLPDDYEVEIYGKAAKFTSKDVVYIVARNSK